MIIRCGNVVLDFARYEASRGGEPLHLRPKVFNLVAYLAERRDRIVPKQELHEYLWSELAVTDSALDTTIKEARRAFSDKGSEQKVIRTVRGRGFRFIGDFEVLDNPGPAPHPPVATVVQSARIEAVSPPYDGDIGPARSVDAERFGTAASPSASEPLSSRALPDSRSWRSRFVGRTRELETLFEKLELAQKGHGRVVSIVGEAGLGKSRLLLELRRRATHCRYVGGRCSPISGDFRSSLVQEMLRAHCGIRYGEPLASIERRLHVALPLQGDDSVGRMNWTPFLLHLLGVFTCPTIHALGPRALQLKTFEALRKILLQGGTARAVVVEVDDLHWVDPYSHAWLEWVQRGISGLPVLLVTTYRPGFFPAWIGRSHTTQIALEPLTEADSRAIIQDTLPRSAQSDSVIGAILRRAGGNPFYLEELSKSPHDAAKNCDDERIPPSILTLLTARISRLTPEARVVLDTIAVVERDVAYSLLRAILDLPDQVLLDQLALLMQEDLLIELAHPTDTVYSIQHSLIRDATYQALPDANRRKLHDRVARTLSSKHNEFVAHCPELLAHHFTQAGLSEEFANCWLRTSEQALQLRLLDEAVVHLQRGLGVLEALPESIARDLQELGLRINLGGALNMAGNHDAATVAAIMNRAEKLRDALAPDPRLFWAYSGFVRHYFFRGELKSARAMSQALRACTESGVDPHLTMATEILYPTYEAIVGLYLGEIDHTYECTTRVLEHHDSSLFAGTASLYLHDPSVLCSAYAGAASLLLGFPERARIQCLESISTARNLAQPWNLAAACTMSAHVHLLLLDFDTAVANAELAEAVSTEHGLSLYGTFLGYIFGATRAYQGDSRGIRDIRVCLDAMTKTGWQLMRTAVLVEYARSLGVAGRIEEAVGALAEAESAFELRGERYMEPEVHRLRGELLLQKGPHYVGLSEALFRQARGVAQERGMKWWELRATASLARLLNATGHPEQARGVLEPICAFFDPDCEAADVKQARSLLHATRQCHSARRAH